MAPSTPCFDHELLHSYLTEELDESHEDRVQEHLENCSVCRKALEEVAGSSELWSEVRAHMADIPSAEESAPDEMLELVALLDRSDDPHKLGRIGSYEICGLIGRGTTGLVLKALESRLNRFVAIKLMSPAYQVNGSARRRFEREGRAVAAVSHEHVVPIHAVDDHRGLPYIVMKYIPGLSLAQRIERDGPLDSYEVARVGLQVAQGLAAAHGQGIVHRDVKPANVILEDTVERAMVTDFGLARVADEASMTHSGTISGTPHYMSPEQARGDLVDSRSDLFSLGSLLYAACTGRPPFRAENVFGVIHRVCKTEARSIRDINPAIDPILVALIEKLMAKPPQERFSSAETVGEA
ncbi:MAG: protein kinase [Planctomycetota bacterium]|nr:protein kinase [Planctomycetota bacterium]